MPIQIPLGDPLYMPDTCLQQIEKYMYLFNIKNSHEHNDQIKKQNQIGNKTNEENKNRDNDVTGKKNKTKYSINIIIN